MMFIAWAHDNKYHVDIIVEETQSTTIYFKHNQDSKQPKKTNMEIDFFPSVVHF